jgi:hypothetical protein
MLSFSISQTDYNVLQRFNAFKIIDVKVIGTYNMFISFISDFTKVRDTYRVFNLSTEEKTVPFTYNICFTHHNTSSHLNNVICAEDLYIYDISIKKLPDSLKVRGTVWADNLDYYPKHLTVKSFNTEL